MMKDAFVFRSPVRMGPNLFSKQANTSAMVPSVGLYADLTQNGYFSRLAIHGHRHARAARNENGQVYPS